MRAEARALLEQAVVACPRGGCALSRLQAYTKSPYEVRLSSLAELHGFTEIEAFGIMDGWDNAVGQRAVFEGQVPAEHPEYSEGRALGKELAVHAANEGEAT